VTGEENKMDNKQYRIIRNDILNIRIQELCKLGYSDDPKPTYEWENVARMGKKEKLCGKIASDMTDAELMEHFQKYPREWGYR
jgi:hypothetical protein